LRYQRARHSLQASATAVLVLLWVVACSSPPSFTPVLPELRAERLERLLEGVTITTSEENECVAPKKKSIADKALDSGFGVPPVGLGQAALKINFTTTQSVESFTDIFRSEADRLGFTKKGEVTSGPHDGYWAENRIRLGSDGRRTSLLIYLRTAEPKGWGYLELAVGCDQLRL
jgi:hypothetical protein